MTPCTFIYPYYENPGMLNMQLENWARFKGELKKTVRIIVVDDGSPKHPAADIVKDFNGPLRVYRINENIPWNQHGARNLGAKMAGKGWLFFTDMDNILTGEAACAMLAKKLNPSVHYTFERVAAPLMEKKNSHCNTFLVRREHYWHVNGYDEDYCGTYGGDGQFLRQLEVIAPPERMKGVAVIYYPRDVVPDASTTEWDRTGKMRQEYLRRLAEKRKTGDLRSKKPLRFTWEQVR